jgi:V/A-type H+-transporting ATPase subunit A
MVMLGGQLLRKGLLQQSALSAADAFCSPEKAAALADGLLAVIDRCAALVESGMPATAVEEIDFGPVLRARDDVGSDDVDGVHRRRDAMLATLGGGS